MPELRAKSRVEECREIDLEVVVGRKRDWDRRHRSIITVSRAREAARIVRSNVLPAKWIGASVSFGTMGVMVPALRAASVSSS